MVVALVEFDGRRVRSFGRFMGKPGVAPGGPRAPLQRFKVFLHVVVLHRRVHHLPVHLARH
jgi:hypothetical protein